MTVKQLRTHHNQHVCVHTLGKPIFAHTYYEVHQYSMTVTVGCKLMTYYAQCPLQYYDNAWRYLYTILM